MYNLAPFTDKDFKIRSLGDRIKDLCNLVTLYPDIPKQTAFGKFWTSQPNLSDPPGGYVRPDIMTTIPGIPG